MTVKPEPSRVLQNLDIWFGWCLENMDTLRASVHLGGLKLFDEVIQGIKDIKSESFALIDTQQEEYIKRLKDIILSAPGADETDFIIKYRKWWDVNYRPLRAKQESKP